MDISKEYVRMCDTAEIQDTCSTDTVQFWGILLISLKILTAWNSSSDSNSSEDSSEILITSIEVKLKLILWSTVRNVGDLKSLTNWFLMREIIIYRKTNIIKNI